MIKIAEDLPSKSSPLWTLVRQCGVRYAVGNLPWDTPAPDAPWDFMPLLMMKQRLADAGFQLAVLESRPPLERTKRGLPGRDEEIANVCTLLENLGRLGVPVWCYVWQATFDWLRTSTTIPTRGGALVTGYDHELMQRAPLAEAGAVSEEQLWESLHYFLQRVLPVAERVGVKLAMHPDDPPISPIRGVGRIMHCVENFQRLLDMAPSPMNGIALCQGNFALMTADLPGTIRHFGRQGKIFFVHMRDVRGIPTKFHETFHDDGQTDMLACMRAYREIGFDGVMRPDHVPTLVGENNDTPGYAALGRLFALGYLKGLREAVYDGQRDEE